MFLKKANTLILIFIISIFIVKINSEDLLFEDFSSFNEKNWEFISDRVMGGISSGNYQIISENKESFLRLKGFVSIENNGGFIQVRKVLTGKKILKFIGVEVKCRGNDANYFIHIRTKFTLLPWQYYQGKFYASSNWKSIKIDLKSFKGSGSLLPKRINSQHIKSIAIVAYGREHRVRLDVSEIKFY